MISLFISYQWYHRYDMHHDLIVISQNYHMIHHKQYYDIIGWIRRWNTSTALNITPLLHWVVPSWIFPAESPCLRGHFPGKSESDTAGSHRFGIFSAAQHGWTSLVVRTTGHCTYPRQGPSWVLPNVVPRWPAVRVEYILYPYILDLFMSNAVPCRPKENSRIANSPQKFRDWCLPSRTLRHLISY